MWKTMLLVLLTTLTSLSEIFCCYPPIKRTGSKCEKLQPYLMQRNQWCAEETSTPIDCMWGPVGYVIIHHTVSGSCTTTDDCSEEMRKLQKDHMAEKKWPDVGYHYVIGGDARVYVGRPCNKMGGHTKNHNRKSIGIAFFGDYQKDSPSAEMLDLVPKIVFCAVEQGYLHPNFIVIGHRDAFCSTCPGDALYDVIKKWPRYPGKVPIPSFNCDAPQATTEVATTTSCPTTTTTTESPTTTTTEAPTTTVATTTEDIWKNDVGLPVYIYLLFSKKHVPCCKG